MGQQQGQRAEAYDLLAPIYGWFTEGFATADLQEAEALLAELGGNTKWSYHAAAPLCPIPSRHTASMSLHCWASSTILPIAYAMMEARMHDARPRPCQQVGELP